jgi:hypothetical protein
MVSTLIYEPQNGDRVAASGFQVRFTTTKFMNGRAEDLDNQYLQIPQTLDPNGMIEGTQTLSIQPIDEQTAPDANVVSFYTILNNVQSDGNGRTDFTVQIPAMQSRGIHRICTLAVSKSGQAAIMPVAQRGAQDDCIRVDIQ